MEEDFRNIQSWWDRLEANADRRYRYHVIGRSDIPLEWGAAPEERKKQEGEFARWRMIEPKKYRCLSDKKIIIYSIYADKTLNSILNLLNNDLIEYYLN